MNWFIFGEESEFVSTQTTKDADYRNDATLLHRNVNNSISNTGRRQSSQYTISGAAGIGKLICSEKDTLTHIVQWRQDNLQ